MLFSARREKGRSRLLLFSTFPCTQLSIHEFAAAPVSLLWVWLLLLRVNLHGLNKYEFEPAAQTAASISLFTCVICSKLWWFVPLVYLEFFACLVNLEHLSFSIKRKCSRDKLTYYFLPIFWFANKFCTKQCITNTFPWEEKVFVNLYFISLTR